MLTLLIQSLKMKEKPFSMGGGAQGGAEAVQSDWSGDCSLSRLQDIENLCCPADEIQFSEPDYSPQIEKLAKDKSFVAKLLASVAEENGCRAAFYDSSKQKVKALPPSDRQFLSLLAPNNDFITPRNIMQLVLVQPHGLWAKIPLDCILGDKQGAREAYIKSLERQICKAHGAEAGDIKVLAIESGGVVVTYACLERRRLRPGYRPRIRGVPSEIAASFRETFGSAYQTLRVHPLYYLLNIDMADIDSTKKASKFFQPLPDPPPDPAEDYVVGPAGAERPYRPPYGWMRIGLKVRNKYVGDRAGQNEWLEPFHDENAGLWYRAYHGTVGEAFAGIVREGFLPSWRGKLGAGVYVSPHHEYADTGYGGRHVVRFRDGVERQYRCIIMCAVRPDAIARQGQKRSRRYRGEGSEWVISDPAAVRAYGILVKEVLATDPDPVSLRPAASAGGGVQGSAPPVVAEPGSSGP